MLNSLWLADHRMDRVEAERCHLLIEGPLNSINRNGSIESVAFGSLDIFENVFVQLSCSW